MFVRDPFETTMTHFLPVTVSSGQPLGQYPSGTEQSLLKQLHAIAVAISQAKQRFESNLAYGDTEQAKRELNTIGTLQAAFADMAVRWRTASEAADPDSISGFDRFVVRTGEWIEQAWALLPDTVSAIPRAAIDTVGKTLKAALDELFALLNQTRNKLGGFVLPPIAVGGLLLLAAIALVGRAERTRTYRRYVA